MKNLVLNSLINNIQRYYSYDEIKLKEIRYGLEAIYLSIIKLILVFIISILLNTTKELILLFIFYGLLRLTGFGLHAKKSIHCWLTSIPTFTIIPFLIKNFSINEKYMYIPLVICFILLSIFAPSDTEKRPLIRKRKRIIYKILTIILTTSYIIYILYSNNNYVNNILFYSTIIETLLVIPLSYKLLGLKYNNYKRYMKGGT